jgi:hypothetical protein
MSRARRLLFAAFAACTAWLVVQNSVLVVLALLGVWRHP